MGLFRKKPTHLIPVNPDNAASKDWIILLEAGTIVGPSPIGYGLLDRHWRKGL